MTEVEEIMAAIGTPFWKRKKKKNRDLVLWGWLPIYFTSTSKRYQNISWHAHMGLRWGRFYKCKLSRGFRKYFYKSLLYLFIYTLNHSGNRKQDNWEPSSFFWAPEEDLHGKRKYRSNTPDHCPAPRIFFFFSVKRTNLCFWLASFLLLIGLFLLSAFSWLDLNYACKFHCKLFFVKKPDENWLVVQQQTIFHEKADRNWLAVQHQKLKADFQWLVCDNIRLKCGLLRTMRPAGSFLGRRIFMASRFFTPLLLKYVQFTWLQQKNSFNSHWEIRKTYEMNSRSTSFLRSSILRCRIFTRDATLLHRWIFILFVYIF